MPRNRTRVAPEDFQERVPSRQIEEYASATPSSDFSQMSARHILQLQRSVGNRAVLRLLQRAPGEGSSSASKRLELAKQVKQDIKAFGGLRVAVYLQNTQGKNNDAEFRRQADQYAKDHQTYGVSGGKFKRGVAMVIDDEVSDLMESVTNEANILLDDFPELFDEANPKPDVKIHMLSVFTHGGRQRLKAGKTGNRWISPDKFVKGMAPLLTASPIINLYACKVAGAVPVDEENFVTEVQESLTEQLNEIYGESFVEVWGHTSTAHTTFNPDLAMTGPTGAVALQQDFGRRLVDMVIEELGAEVDEGQRATLEKAAAKVIRQTFSPRQKKGDSEPPSKSSKGWFTGSRNPMNVYFREIGLLGLDRVWEDLTAASDPTDYSDLGMSEEAQDRLIEGVRFFRERFQRHRAAFKTKAESIIGVTPVEPIPTGDLSEEEVHGAIQYNNYRGYNTDQIEDIQHEVSVTPTGFFEPPTVLAVAHWQDQRGLTDDGKVGPNTHKEMFGSANQPNKQQPNPNQPGTQEDKPEESNWWTSLWETVTGWFD